jgi:hypothetical protein
MEEIRHIISHLLGVCGDAHPNILSVLAGDVSFLTYIQQVIKFKLKI